MVLVRRPFAGPQDVLAIEAFQASAIAAAGHNGYMHPGDAPHRMYNEARHSPLREVVTLWEDGTGLQAWLLVSARLAALELQVHPAARERYPGIEGDAMAFAEEQLADSGASTIETEGDRGDAHRLGVLESRGWTMAEPFITVNRRRLSGLPATEAPPGFTIRSVAGVVEADAVAEVHRGSFGSTWTGEQYTAVMVFPCYDPARELVAIAPDGRMAGFTVTWYDRRNGTGLFEPVGTHEEFRRMGVASALLGAGMARMREAGLAWAIVGNEVENDASRLLYRSVGFTPWLEIDTWRKAIPVNPGS